MKKERTKKNEQPPRLIIVKPLEVTPVGDLTGFEAVLDDAKPAKNREG